MGNTPETQHSLRILRNVMSPLLWATLGRGFTGIVREPQHRSLLLVSYHATFDQFFQSLLVYEILYPRTPRYFGCGPWMISGDVYLPCLNHPLRRLRPGRQRSGCTDTQRMKGDFAGIVSFLI